MKAIHETAGQDLQWIRTKWWKREFVLRSGDEVLARLYKEKGTGRIIGEAADGTWAFKRRSFRNSDIVITDLASQSEIAVVKQGRKPAVVFADGDMFAWNKKGFWRNEWDWVDGDGNPLIHFQRGKRVMIEPPALALPELSLLVITGWHLIVLQQEAAAAAAGAAAAVSG